MALIETQTDNSTTPCSTGNANRLMAVGGTAGSTEISLNIGTSQGAKNLDFQDALGTTATWSSGSWTFRVNCTVAEMSSTWDSVQVNRYNSSCALQENLLSVGLLGISLGTTGTKSTTQTGTTGTPAAGDILIVRYTFSSTSHTATVGITPSENIDSPFTASSGALTQTKADSINNWGEALALGYGLQLGDNLNA